MKYFKSAFDFHNTPSEDIVGLLSKDQNLPLFFKKW